MITHLPLNMFIYQNQNVHIHCVRECSGWSLSCLELHVWTGDAILHEPAESVAIRTCSLQRVQFCSTAMWLYMKRLRTKSVPADESLRRTSKRIQNYSKYFSVFAYDVVSVWLRLPQICMTWYCVEHFWLASVALGRPWPDWVCFFRLFVISGQFLRKQIKN